MGIHRTRRAPGQAHEATFTGLEVSMEQDAVLFMEFKCGGWPRIELQNPKGIVLHDEVEPT